VELHSAIFREANSGFKKLRNLIKTFTGILKTIELRNKDNITHPAIEMELLTDRNDDIFNTCSVYYRMECDSPRLARNSPVCLLSHRDALATINEEIHTLEYV
jgi:hypothetical protein